MKTLSDFLNKEDVIVDPKTKGSDGIYVGVRYSDKTKKLLTELIETYHIPNAVKDKGFHSTLIYSKVSPEERLTLHEYKKPMSIGEHFKPEIWKQQNDSYCLVITFDSPWLVNRHQTIMSERQELTYDFAEYKPHITLSYDVHKEFPYDEIKLPKKMKLLLETEYQEALNIDYIVGGTEEDSGLSGSGTTSDSEYHPELDINYGNYHSDY